MLAGGKERQQPEETVDIARHPVIRASQHASLREAREFRDRIIFGSQLLLLSRRFTAYIIMPVNRIPVK